MKILRVGVLLRHEKTFLDDDDDDEDDADNTSFPVPVFTMECNTEEMKEFFLCLDDTICTILGSFTAGNVSCHCGDFLFLRCCQFVGCFWGGINPAYGRQEGLHNGQDR